MKKSFVIVLLVAVICPFLNACKSTDNLEPLIEMQMVYEDNPAFFFKDMKLIWGEKSYYESYVSGAKRGREIGYVTDEYSGWRIYELKGYGRDYLMAVENGNEDCWRIISVYPPEKPWRQYILENATDSARGSKLLSVTLYEDGTVLLATPPISSYIVVNCCYAFENDELLIFQSKEDMIARFMVLDDNTLIFTSATVPLFADAGARYVRMAENDPK